MNMKKARLQIITICIKFHVKFRFHCYPTMSMPTVSLVSVPLSSHAYLNSRPIRQSLVQ